MSYLVFLFFFKQKTAYELRISDWSSDVCSSDLAGALAGAWYARRLGEERLLCFDMGGTTAKSCLIEQFEPELTNDFEVARIYRHKKGSGFPVTVPSVDLVQIGAGGGSIARTDRPDERR